MKTFSVAIIGFGPKGLYALERLLAFIKAEKTHQISIYVFNKTSFFGSGDIYRSDQPHYLLMNYANENINSWYKNEPEPIVKNAESYVEWKARKEKIQQEELLEKFSARAEVGEYLEWSFQQLLENLPKNCSIHQEVIEIGDLQKENEKIQLFSTSTEKYHVKFDQVMITTGHQRHKIEKNHSQVIPFIYPVEKKLEEILPNKTIAIKGLGLTFIDAVLALTEGKGGKFTKIKNGFSYQFSGSEPKKIIPFSRTGLPMFPKLNLKDENLPSYLSQATSKFSRPYDFEKELFPLILQDILFAYYKSFFQQKNEKLSYAEDFKKVEQQIEKFHQKYPKIEKFSWKKLTNPHFSTENLHDATAKYLSFLISEKEKPRESPYLMAASAWKKISAEFNELYSFNGLTPKSQELFDKTYFGLFNRIAFGPPVKNLQKIQALVECGIIDFSFVKNPIVDLNSEKVQLKKSHEIVDCDYLIDARIPKNDMEKEQSGLFKNIIQHKFGRLNKNKSDDFTYIPGNLAISKKGDLLEPSGKPDAQISLYGTPTEGSVYDNDTLSRERNNFADCWAQKAIQAIKNKTHA
ncbi:FAD/NAD(P)-binding protein [Mesonia maritima]|uniref:NAD(P)/FAD-binding protein YdhS n=1 Tax=Mesonia maritima TaxID=1793873 RepID=A0ABU1K7J8_9FLAO|nr:FAD/NAD(P)-binding protein [Mesonia maritima]MDR6301583.1 putative NAD(P)/FAD-binding protein YdhS [Mesonia maritima]